MMMRLVSTTSRAMRKLYPTISIVRLRTAKTLTLRVVTELRTRAKITFHFGITSSHHLWPRLNRKILDVALLRLRFRSIASAKSGANLRAKPANLFLRGPLLPKGLLPASPYRLERCLPFGGSGPSTCLLDVDELHRTTAASVTCPEDIIRIVLSNPTFHIGGYPGIQCVIRAPQNIDEPIAQCMSRNTSYQPKADTTC